MIVEVFPIKMDKIRNELDKFDNENESSTV
jgi:hypothetical protein